MFLHFKQFEVPLFYHFQDPDTGMQFKGRNIRDLIKEIAAYRTQNDLDPIDQLGAIIENYTCSLPEFAGKCTENVKVARSFADYVRGGVALLTARRYKTFAPQAVAEERAAQCIQCPFNVFPDKGPFMSWADDQAAEMVGERKVKNAHKLGNCAVCSCPLRAKVFIDAKLKPFPEDQLSKMKSVQCWQLKLSNQE